ncbi:hypothetical protein M0811_14184 [Anaeramoeba ignava]|uniref:Uncharacterized protein n=1 Tax=Anaeramoeba ignava TaxID=1746090 RepID=A0A9Q0RHC4_ANAIG|nr:hypothetical protein M0811_14184 [Anaeramoeba ignava]
MEQKFILFFQNKIYLFSYQIIPFWEKSYIQKPQKEIKPLYKVDQIWGNLILLKKEMVLVLLNVCKNMKNGQKHQLYFKNLQQISNWHSNYREMNKSYKN